MNIFQHIIDIIKGLRSIQPLRSVYCKESFISITVSSAKYIQAGNV